MKGEAGSLRKTNKVDKPLARHHRKKKKTQNTKIHKTTNEKGEIATNTTEIQSHKGILWKNTCQQIANLEEMIKFLEKIKRPTSKQEEIENWTDGYPVSVRKWSR